MIKFTAVMKGRLLENRILLDQINILKFLLKRGFKNEKVIFKSQKYL